MKKLLVTLLAAITALTLCVPAFAEEAAPAEPAALGETAAAAEAEETKDFYPVIGSWMLGQVFEVKEGAEPTLLKKEENQSLYGSGKSIFTFDEDGNASCMTFDAGDSVDEAAEWKTTSPDVFVYTDEDGLKTTFKYNKDEDTLHKTLEEADRTLDFVYNRAIVGDWTLETVLEIHPGDAPETLDPEANQSLYSSANNVITFKADGTASETVQDGEDTAQEEGTWKMKDPDTYVCTQMGVEIELDYFRVDDTLFRNVIDNSPEAAHPYLRFIFTRVEPTEEAAPEKQAENAEPAPEKKDNAPRMTGRTMDLSHPEGGGLIVTLYELTDGTWIDANGMVYTKASDTEWFAADNSKWVTGDYFINNPVGQVFTGFGINLYDASGSGAVIYVDQLSDGRYVDKNTGVIYTEEAGGGDLYYGTDGSAWVDEWYYKTQIAGNTSTEEELINDGQIFTGRQLALYDPYTGAVVTLSELSQGGWANAANGVIYTQEAGGGDHFYGNNGSVLVTQWYYETYIAGGQGYQEEELINDGQIFTGQQMTLYDAATGAPVVVKELSQGGWAAENSGVIYTQGSDNTHFYGNDGSELIMK